MSLNGQALGSNNPFRRNPGAVASVDSTASPSQSADLSLGFGIDGSLASPTLAPTFTPATVTTAPTRPPATTFKSAVQETEWQDEEEQPVQQRPKKIVKKVRVQSPPPSPPEDAVPVTRFLAPERSDDGSRNDDDSESASDSSKSDHQLDDQFDDQFDDPFDAPAADPDSKPPLESALPQIPPNPFARTLQDIEGGGQAHGVDAAAAPASASKGSLDVDSFKRLLLTGYANLPNLSNPTQTPPEPAGTPGAAPSLGAIHDEANATDTNPISKQSILSAPHEMPRAPHEISEFEVLEERKGILPSSPLGAVSSASARQKPPPPSSRHGKLIKMELGPEPVSRRGNPASSSKVADLPSAFGLTSRKAGSESTASLQSPQGITNINKPLPAPPFRPLTEEDVESPFDREAAGKVPEPFFESQVNPRPPTPSPTTRSRSGSQNSIQSRNKPAAPPPRRHGRNDGKAPSVYTVNGDEEPPRSSIESTRSRPESLRVNANFERSSHAPAPPPPRRPGHTRQGSSFVSASQGSFPPATSPGLDEKERSPLGSITPPLASHNTQPGHSQISGMTAARLNGQTKLSPPPPPPTRKPSTRRPASVVGNGASNGLASVRKVSREKDGAIPLPPPPPPRARGGARPISDPPVLGEEGSQETRASPISPESGSTTPLTAGGRKQGEEILADLDALQREVDELMKKAAT